MPLCAIAGVWSGWVVVGKRGGRGNAAGIGNGLTGVAALIFWVLFVTSFVDMINKSMRSAYDGPLEALVNVFELAIGHAIRLGTTDVLTAAVCGGIIAGLITEYITKRLP